MKLKRTIGLLLSIVMTVSSLSVGFAEETEKAEPTAAVDEDTALSEGAVIADTEVRNLLASSTDIAYPVEDGNIYFDASTGTITDADETITKADIYIGYPAFYQCSSLTSITIPDGVDSINNYAFGGCSSLTSIIIPESVTYIDNYAFRGCNKNKLIFYVKQNSYADTWAKENGWKVSYDTTPTTSTTTTTETTTQPITTTVTTQATTKTPTTQATTKAPTTQATTKAPVTQATTQKVTEKPTETTTQKVTEKPSQATTKATTTQATTQSLTEKPTETTTKATVTETGTETTTKRTSSGGRGSSGGGGGGSSSAKTTTEAATEITTAKSEPKTEETTAKAEPNITGEPTVPNTIPEVAVSIGSNVISIDGKNFEMDTAPYIQTSSNSTLVPLRFVAVVLSGEDIENADNSKAILWDAVSKQATVTNGTNIAVFTAGSSTVDINGVKTAMENGVKAEIKDGRMFVPFRAIGNFLGVQVDWDADTKTAVYTAK